jgi:hypothetical protein
MHFGVVMAIPMIARNTAQCGMPLPVDSIAQSIRPELCFDEQFTARAHRSIPSAGTKSLGVRFQKSWRYCKEPVWNNISQQIIEAAVKSYRPETYKGDLLLVPVSNRPPHRDFFQGGKRLWPKGYTLTTFRRITGIWWSHSMCARLLVQSLS